MAFDISALTPKEQISLIYIGYFDRAPEPAGLNFWEIQLEEFLDGSSDGVAGMNLEAIATDFSTQQETRDVYDFFDPGSTISAGNFLTNVYLNLFGRLPDSEGLQFWTNVLNNGELPVGQVILEIIGGAQGSDILVLENKLSVAIDWHDTAEANGVFIPDAAGAASAASVLDGVTADPASVVAAKAQTADFFNTAPVAGNEFVTINEDGVINGDVGDNTSDADGDTLTHSVEAGDGASNGTVVMNADGTYTYTPNADFNGTDSFTYTVKDGKGGVDTATVNVTVAAVNDAPVALAANTTTAEDNSVSGSVASSDVDGGTPTYSVSGNPANGSVTMNPNGTYTYTPNDDFNGSDSFEYTVSDGQGGVDTATVNVTVTAVDDAPVTQDESASVNEDAFILNGQLDANDIDNDNANITFALNAAAPAGLVLAANGTYTFDASVAAYQGLAAGVTQVITAGYTATSNGKSDTGTITITVTGTNDAPVAQAASASTVEDTTISGTLSATDKDNGDTLTYSLATGAANGDVTVNQNGTFVYDPNANFNGVDSFTYTVTDSAGATSTATVNIGVSAVDDVLTTGVDIINGGQGDDIIIGNENTLNAGDSVTGGDGTDTVIVNVETGVDVNIFNQADDFSFGGFSLNVETFQTTVDGDGSATFDMSGSEITGNTFVNSNSSGDVTFNAVNMTAGGTNGDDNNDGLPDDLVSLELRNVTNNADTTVTTRPAQVSGATDAANILATNVDSNAIIGDVNFFGAPGSSSASGIETFNLSTAGSPQMVSIEDLNTPGATTLNIAAASTGLIIGDPDADVDISGTVGDRQIVGFENDLSSTISVVDGSASTGGFGVGLQDANDDVTVTGGVGNDTVEGSDNDDSISGNGGADLLDGDDGDDTINGGEGNDTLFGGDDDDLINGGDDNDVIDGGQGNDILNGDDGNDRIHTGNAAAIEFVDGGAGSDSVTTNVQHLDGTGGTVDQLSGGADAGDTLFLEGTSSTDVNGLNYVQQFETIELDGSGPQDFVIGNNSAFETDHDARVAAGNADGSTTIDGTNAGSDVDVDATTLNEAITLIGGDSDDELRGGRGNDVIIGDGDLNGPGGDDVLEGGAGDDIFRMGASQLDGDDTIDGDLGVDTIEIANRSTFTTATLNGNVGGIELLKVLDAAGSNGQSFNLSFLGFDNTDNVTINHDGTNADQTDAVLHVDGSELDAGETMNIDMSGNGFDEDIQVTGGAGADNIDMGVYLDAGDTIDGGDGFDTVIVSDSQNTDFTNVSNIEQITVRGAVDGDTIVFGADAEAAFAAGVTPRIVLDNAPGVNVTIDTTAFAGSVIIVDDINNNTFNTGGGDDTIIASTGDDTFNTGGGADVIRVSGNDLDVNDVLNTGAGNDTVEMDNSTGAVTAVSNLNTNATVENYVLTDDGDRLLGTDADNNSLEFQNGNVGTLTTVNVDATALTDADDSFTVALNANQTDADFAFNVEGSSTGDTFEKRNDGVDNNIEFNGNDGNDNLILNGGDAGSTTAYNGGAGDDSITLSGGQITDDGFVSMESIEILASESGVAVDARLGTEADRSGLIVITGSDQDDDVVSDAQFDNDLTVSTGAGDDRFDFGASSGAVTFEAAAGETDASDALIGGTGTDDSIILTFSQNGETADVSGMSGIETINITETGSSSNTYNLTLGNTTNDNPGNALTINEDGFEGETLNVDGSTYTGNITYNGEVGSAVSNVTTGSGNDSVDGGSLGDTLITNGGNDVVNGEAGNDTINSGSGDDIVNGGADNDVIDGGAGSDTIDGGIGNDTITGGADGATGDVLTGGAGADDFRYVNRADSDGLVHDTITDFVSGTDQIMIEESVLQDAGGGAASVSFIGNAPNFAQAQGAIGTTGGDGVADWIFQAANAVEAATIWVDLNDDGILNGLDLQIEVPTVTSMQAADLFLTDTVTPDAPTITSVTTDTGAVDFITNDNSNVEIQVDFSNAADGTGARVGDTITLAGLPGGSQTSAPLTATDIANGFVVFTDTDAAATDGTYSLSATVNDTFGATQTSAAATQDLVIDTTVSVAITSVSDDVDNTPTGVINGAEQSSVVVTGTTDAEDSQSVTLTFSDGVNPNIVVTGVVISGGTFDTTGMNIDVSSLNEGAITVTADVTDVAGNTASNNFGATKDTLAVVSIDTSGALSDGIISAAEFAALTVNGTTLNVETGNTVTYSISDGVNSIGNTVVTTAGTPDTWTDTLLLGDSTATGNISAANEIDSFVFNLVAGETYTFDVRGTATGGGTLSDPEIRLLDPSSAFIINDDDSGPGLDARIVYTATQTGAFTLEVADFPFSNTGNATGIGTGTYTVDVSTSGILNDGAATVTATTTDDAGNMATDIVNVVIDTTGPVYTVDSIVYDETAGTITVNGDFSGVTAADTVDVTQAIWQDGGSGPIPVNHTDFVETATLGAATTWFGTANQVVLTWASPAQQAAFEAAASVGGVAEDTLDFGAGTLVDAVGNGSVEALGNEITLEISTTVQGVATLTGFGGDDILTADNTVADSLTGNNGADTFVIDTPLATGVVGTITDFDASEGDLIQFDASDLNTFGGAPFGNAYTTTSDGAEIAFRTFIEDGNGDNGDAVAATTFAGTIIFDALNERLLIDANGDTSFNGFAILNDADDLIVDLTGISGSVTGDDIGFI